MYDFDILSMYEEKKPVVYAYKCPKCGKLFYPVPMLCDNCNNRRDPSGYFLPSWDETKFAVEGKCRLLAWTKVYALPEGYEVPYILFGVVEFENGLRASGRLAVENPQTGMALNAEAGVVKTRKSKDYYGLIFNES